MAKLPKAPRLTWTRVVLALVVAAVADGIQILLLPVGWTGAESVVDFGAMAATMALLGFHPLLLPTFALELVPFVDALPTWIACVLAVIALRRNELKEPAPPPVVVRPPELPEK